MGSVVCSHLTGAVKSVLLKGGMTSQLRPLVMAVNKPFKDRLRKHCNDCLTLQDHQLAPTGCIKRTSPSQVANWVAVAWGEIPAEVIVRALRECSIVNALDVIEDCALWEEHGDDEDNGDE